MTTAAHRKLGPELAREIDDERHVLCVCYPRDGRRPQVEVTQKDLALRVVVLVVRGDQPTMESRREAGEVDGI